MKHLYATSGLVILLDQLTKLWVTAKIPLYGGVEVISGFFNLVHVRNTGGAFSILAGTPSVWRQLFFTVVTLGVVFLLLMVYRKVAARDYWSKTAYALIIGGALGNLMDRIRLGAVVDFLDVHWKGYHWPAFNVADAAITTGAVMLIIALLRGK